jgi:hypothetical protein
MIALSVLACESCEGFLCSQLKMEDLVVLEALAHNAPSGLIAYSI